MAAQQWAITQKKILLIDAHLENPQFQFFDELRANQSLRDYLIIEQMKETQIITNYQPNIDLVYCEKLAIIPNLKRLSTFLEWAQQQYDLVLIYAPCEELWNLGHSIQVLWVEEENTKIKEYTRFSKNIVKTREKRIFSGYLKVTKEA